MSTSRVLLVAIGFTAGRAHSWLEMVTVAAVGSFILVVAEAVGPEIARWRHKRKTDHA